MALVFYFSYIRGVFRVCFGDIKLDLWMFVYLLSRTFMYSGAIIRNYEDFLMFFDIIDSNYRSVTAYNNIPISPSAYKDYS